MDLPRDRSCRSLDNEEGIDMVKRLALAHLLAYIVAGIAVVAAFTSAVVPNLHDMPAHVRPQIYGTEYAVLLVGAPLLLITTALSARGRIGARALWFGAVAWFLSTYVALATGLGIGPLFPIHTALFFLSLATLVIAFVSIDLDTFGDALPRGSARVGLIGGFIAMIALMAVASRIDPVHATEQWTAAVLFGIAAFLFGVRSVWAPIIGGIGTVMTSLFGASLIARSGYLGVKGVSISGASIWLAVAVFFVSSALGIALAITMRPVPDDVET